MAEKSVVWTQTAIKQRRFILAYWNKKNKSTSYSEKLIDAISLRLLQIVTHPKSAKRADYPETRVISLGHYSLFYRIKKSLIIITAFWDNRQDPTKIYQQLKK